MYSAQMKVRRFHEVFKCLTNDGPTLIQQHDWILRNNLIAEELDEYYAACYDGDLPRVADAIGDMLYVVLGTAVAHGINIDPIFEAIHNANMAKLGGGQREDGKILKPEGWQPPDIKAELLKQGWQCPLDGRNCKGHPHG